MSTEDFAADMECARRMDERDELASFRDAFVIDDPDLIYADGNSLGRLPVRTVERIQEVIQQEWGRDLIGGWNAGWYDASARVGDKIGGLIGAAPGQVIVSDSTSVNLFKLLMAALSLLPKRCKIISDVFNFPSDLYIIQGCMQLAGNRHTLYLAPSHDGISIDCNALYDSIDENTAVVTLSHVAFKSAFLYDMKEITRRAHEAGAVVIWDLSHSVGAVPIELDACGADFAVGCTYKYLNGGPGAPAFLYVRKILQAAATSPIWGWFGQRAPFAFDLNYVPADGISRFMVGTPPIISLLAMESAVDLVLEAGMTNIRDKSVTMTTYVTRLVESILAPLGFTLGSPADPSQRGSHVSIRHPEAYRITRALIEEMNVMPDFREPDNIRLGLSPLYISYSDIWEMVDRIRRVVVEGRFEKYSAERSPVT